MKRSHLAPTAGTPALTGRFPFSKSVVHNQCPCLYVLGSVLCYRFTAKGFIAHFAAPGGGAQSTPSEQGQRLTGSSTTSSVSLFFVLPPKTMAYIGSSLLYSYRARYVGQQGESWATPCSDASCWTMQLCPHFPLCILCRRPSCHAGISKGFCGYGAVKCFALFEVQQLRCLLAEAAAQCSRIRCKTLMHCQWR